jgi:hypothetical protein
MGGSARCGVNALTREDRRGGDSPETEVRRLNVDGWSAARRDDRAPDHSARSRLSLGAVTK